MNIFHNFVKKKHTHFTMFHTANAIKMKFNEAPLAFTEFRSSGFERVTGRRTLYT